MKKYVRYGIILLLMVLTLSLLLGCGGKNKADKKKLQETKQEFREQQKALCGNGVCHGAETAENCPADCAVDVIVDDETEDDAQDDLDDEADDGTDDEGELECTLDEDCDEGYVCSEENECVEEPRDFPEWREQNWYDRLDRLDDQGDEIFDLFDPVYDLLESYTVEIESDEYLEIEEDIDDYYDDVEIIVEEKQSDIGLLIGRVSGLNFDIYDVFVDDYWDLREVLSDTKAGIIDELLEFYVGIYDAAGVEGVDLVPKRTSLSGYEDGTATYVTSIRNVGNMDVNIAFDVTVELEVVDEVSYTCTKEVDEIDQVEALEVLCDFDVEDQYAALESGDADYFDAIITITVDDEDKVDELYEGNNVLEWKETWVLEYFE